MNSQFRRAWLIATVVVLDPADEVGCHLGWVGCDLSGFGTQLVPGLEVCQGFEVLAAHGLLEDERVAQGHSEITVSE